MKKVVVFASWSVLFVAFTAPARLAAEPHSILKTLVAHALPPQTPELRALSYVHYTPTTEWFPEFKPLIAGKPARFTVHLTKLGSKFLPYTEGEVTLTMQQNGKTVWKQTLKQPTAPGIFRFPVQVESAGKGRITLDLVTTGHTEQFILEEVEVYANEQAALANQSPTAPEEAITYYKEKSWLEAFATNPVGKGHIHGPKPLENVLTIPLSALVQTKDAAYVYVQLTPERFRKQPITLGSRDKKNVQVVSGLQEGDRIITLGTDKVK